MEFWKWEDLIIIKRMQHWSKKMLSVTKNKGSVWVWPNNLIGFLRGIWREDLASKIAEDFKTRLEWVNMKIENMTDSSKWKIKFKKNELQSCIRDFLWKNVTQDLLDSGYFHRYNITKKKLKTDKTKEIHEWRQQDSSWVF